MDMSEWNSSHKVFFSFLGIALICLCGCNPDLRNKQDVTESISVEMPSKIEQNRESHEESEQSLPTHTYYRTLILNNKMVIDTIVVEGAPSLPGYYPNLKGSYRTIPYSPPDQKTMDDSWLGLLEMARDKRLKKEAEKKKLAEEAGLELEPWYCIGPFKSKLIGNYKEEFNTVFGPEKVALEAGPGLIDLTQTWEVNKLPGILETTREWKKHPEWLDGYFHQLPMGPPPAYNETIYLYRTISAENEVSIDMDIHGEDAVKVWINGKEIGEAFFIYGSTPPARSSIFPAILDKKLDLQKGKNRLLVKITRMHGTRGFAFAIPLVTPYTEYRPNQPIESVERLNPGNESFASSTNVNPSELEARYRVYHDRKAWKGGGIVYTGHLGEATNGYVKAILEKLSLLEEDTTVQYGIPPEARALLPLGKATYFGMVPIVRDLFYRACKYTDALERVKNFKFDVPVTAMYDPPVLEMDRILDETFPPTPGGQAYINRIVVLKKEAEKSLELVDLAAPGATEAITRVSENIEKMWIEIIGSLEPIAFIKSPPYFVNPLVPNTADGDNPSSICIYDPSRPADPPSVIYYDPDGAIFDMNISYDAQTIFFSARRGSLKNYWHIYEINIDGTGLKQITHGSSDNISPVLLPNGEIVFVSARANTRVDCQPEPAGHLYVANRDGSNIRRISGNTHSDHTPQVMDDGRILFSRWDYGVDKNVFARQNLWTVNPDGTNLQLFSGNTIEDPNAFWEARPLPGRPEVVCVFGPHHFYQAGMIGLVWNRLGFEVPRGQGFRWITDEVPILEDLEIPWGYQDPYPINERLFLASYGGDGEYKNRIYILDDRGNRKCIYEDNWLGCWDPILLRPQKKPTVIASTTKPEEFVQLNPVVENKNPTYEWGTFFVQDVYEGLVPHVDRGEIKSLAIMEQLSKPFEPTRGSMGYAPVIGRGTMFVRRIFGTVPVEADGSAHFKAPAIKDISINALDSDGRTVMRMGSTFQIMPGEIQSCIGCHEHRHMAPPAKKGIPIAAQREPSIPELPDWGTSGIVDFVKVVQPVLDKHCVKCHSGPAPEATVDLSNDKTQRFNMGYTQLLDRGLANFTMMNGTDHEETTPKGFGSIVSRIRDFIETDHSGQILPLEDRKRIYTWIDSGVPYYGTYFVKNIRMGRQRFSDADRSSWYSTEYTPVFQRRCSDCHKRTISVQGYNFFRTEGTVSSKIWDNNYSARVVIGGLRGEPMHRINLTHPEWSLTLTAPLSKDAGGLGLCQEKDGTPYIFKDKNDPDYQAFLSAITRGHELIVAEPRVDLFEFWNNTYLQPNWIDEF